MTAPPPDAPRARDPSEAELPTHGPAARSTARSSLPPRAFGRASVFLPTGSESARFDRWAIDEAGVPAPVLMENAGRSAALVLDRIWPRGRVLVAVGSGNNGGDGVVLARTLAAQGRDVEILAVGDRSSPEPLLHGWTLPIRPVSDRDEDLESLLLRADVLVDALLGTGVSGAPRPPYDRVVRLVNRVARPVLSLDIPSGVDSDSGAVPGQAVEAEVTVAFGDPKLGSLRFPGRAHAGRLVAVEIGFPPAGPRGTGSEPHAEAPHPEPPGQARLITSGWAALHRPRRAMVTHKKAAGHLLLLAGSSGMAGAAVLAARGALRGGAGYVQVVSSAENRVVLQAAVPEALFVDPSDTDALEEAIRGCDAIAAGPGMGRGDRAARHLDHVLTVAAEREGEPPALLLDADALTLLGAGRLPSFEGAAVADRTLLTPHPGEMARLGADSEEIRNDPLGVCRRGSRRWGAALLLKGSPSLVAEAGRPTVWVSANGSSDLARAGMGDTLTGATGAFLARGCPAITAAALALHFTGRAAQLAGLGEALLPSDVSDFLGPALEEPQVSGSELELPFVTLDLDPAH